MDMKIDKTTSDVRFAVPKTINLRKRAYQSNVSKVSTTTVPIIRTEELTNMVLTDTKTRSAKAVCQFCKKTHDQEQAKDLDGSSKEKPFKCQFCKEIFSISCLFIEHMESHLGKSFYLCEFCGNLFEDFFAMISHRKEHLTYSCKQCNQKFGLEEELMKHEVRWHPPTKKKKNTSGLHDVNKKIFSLKIDQILQRNTDVLKPFHTCDICYKSFPQLSHLLAHKKTHTKEKPFKCVACGKNFKHNIVLKIHQQLHSGNEKYVCEYCGRSFSQCCHLVSHIRTHSKEKTETIPLKENSTKGKATSLLLAAHLMSATSSYTKQIKNPSLHIVENLTPAHSGAGGKTIYRYCETSPGSDAPLDFCQKAPLAAVRNSVIQQVGRDATMSTRQIVPLNASSSGKTNSMSPVVNMSAIERLLSKVADTDITVQNGVTKDKTQPIVKGNYLIRKLPSEVKEEPVYGSIQMESSQPLPDSVIPVTNLLKVEFLDVKPTSVINFTKSDSEALDLEYMEPIALVKSEPVERNNSKEDTSPIRLKVPSDVDKVPTEKKQSTVVSYELSNGNIALNGQNSAKVEEKEVVENKPVFRADIRTEAPLSLVKQEPVQDPLPTSRIQNNTDKSPELEPVPLNGKTSNNNKENCVYCGKIHSKELIQFLENSPKDKPFKCQFCGDIFSVGCLFSKHNETHKGNILYRCGFCGKIFEEFLSLISHRNSMHSSYTCAQCNQIFICESDLKRHSRLVHYVEKTYDCEYCGKSFSQKCNLTFHTHTHTGEQPYSCEHCGRRFARPGNLNVHMRTHSKLKPHKCNTCDKAFKTSSQLKCHVRLHVRETPFKCDLCGDSFSHHRVLKEHTQSHHTDDKLPYECELCGKRYLHSYMLLQHKLSHRGKTCQTGRTRHYHQIPKN